MNFRKLIAGINKKLGTVQINQCEGNWAEIIPNNQTIFGGGAHLHTHVF